MKNKTKNRQFYFNTLAVSVGLLMAMPSWADDITQNSTQNSTQSSVQSDNEVVDLGVLKVTADKSTNAQGVLGEQVVTARELNEQNIQNSQDLVRYSTEVDTADIGRYGNKGFAIRGVDGNRVAMSVDGVALPEVEINEIFSPYGYMYEGRFNPDVEMMRAVRISAGADSLMSGSGAVGGSVGYLTKEPSTIASDGLGGYAKVGYASKNEEWLKSVGLAGVYDRVEFLLNYAHRKGSETKNHTMRSADSARLNPSYVFDTQEMPDEDTSSLIYPNPLTFERQSATAKLYYHLNDNHRVGLHGFYQKQTNLMNTESANTTGDRTGLATRRAHDKEELESYGASYRYRPNQPVLFDEVSLDYTQSKVLGLADTWIYSRSFGCSDPSSYWWNCNGEQVLESSKLSHQEYRPTTTKTDQTSLKITAMPFALGKLGEHTISLQGAYRKQDYTTSATYLSHTPSIGSHLSYAFVDAKKSNYHVSLLDDIYVNDRLKASVGVRYDNYRYRPYFQNDVNGFDENDNNKNMCINNNADSVFCEWYRTHGDLPKSRFSHMTYAGRVDWGIDDKLTARYKIGTGFLAPTATQIYSNFVGMGVMQVPNYTLKPETSLNQELELEYKPISDLSLTASGYVSRYDDFIHTRYWEGKTNGCNGRAICLQSMNLDKAKVQGLKLGVQADLSKALNLNGQFVVSANYHTAHDSATINTDNNGSLTINTLSAPPKMLILGADYVSPNQDWSLHGKMRIIGRKKAQDTKSLQVRPVESLTTTSCPSDIAYYGYCEYYGYTQDSSGNYTKTQTAITGYEEYVDTYEHIDRSKTAVVYDIYGTKRFGKQNQMILNAGVYNITDEKYIPWEVLRMFNTVNANNLVDSSGYGFARYTAPGRNYAVSLTYEF